MKKRIRLKGRIRTYIQFTLYLGLLLLAIDAAVFMLDFRAGLLTFGFTIFYFAITLTLYFYNKPIIMNERNMVRSSENCCGIWNCHMPFWTIPAR